MPLLTGGDNERADIPRFREGIRWGKKLLARPVAAFVSSAAIGPNTPPDIRGGLVINGGEDAAEFKTALENAQAALPVQPEKVQINGVSCYRLKLGPGALPVEWGISDKHLMVGVGEGVLKGMLKRASGEVPAWLTAAKKQVPVQRLSTFTYINIKKLVQQFAPLGGPQAQAVIDAAGLGNVTTLAAATGLEGEGIVSRTLLGIEGQPAGIFSLSASKPLTAKDMAPIPRDANVAVACRFDLARAIDTGLDIAEKIQPQAKEEVEQVLGVVKQRLDVDLRKDIVDSLGDVWCLYNSPDEGGLLFTGLTAVVRVQDYDRLSGAHAKLLAVAQAELGQPPAGAFARPKPRIEHFQFAGQDIYFLSANDVPFAPAWCLTHKELIVAAFPQQIKAYLSRGSDFKSLAELPEVADIFKKEADGPVSLSYFDPRGFFDHIYPLLCVGMQMASRELAHQGVDLNVAMIPSAPTIARHLRPSISCVRRTDAGIESTSRGTIPATSLTSIAPVAIGLLLPAVQSARESARRAQSMNNMKQIVLAMLNYESANGRLPPAYIANEKTGKPLLSWRVAILPYLEQQALYQEFHLDEPWDSEHNKKLAEKVVAVYRSPVSNAKPGMTNYLTVRGKDTAFPGKEGVKMSQITDGTSNTIALVEANDSKAVPWTKPDDFKYDEKNPGLGGLFPHGFNAAMCDGSVHFINSTIDADTLRNLFNIHDGNAVDQSKF